MSSIDDEWDMFLNSENNMSCGFPSISCNMSLKKEGSKNKDSVNESEKNNLGVAPECDELYISTKTKVLFLNKPVDIQNIFWKIPVIEYWRPTNGVIKKQMKIVSKSPEEYEEYRKKLHGIG